MMKHHAIKSALYLVLALALLATRPAAAAVYQYGFVLPQEKGNPQLWTSSRVFLWIPPRLRHIRCVLLAPANVIEGQFCKSPIIRAEAARDGIAIVFFDPGWKFNMLGSPNLIPFLQGILDRLASISGYGELKTVPWIPIGHSGNSFFVSDVLRYATDRVLAAIFINGALIEPVGANTTGVGGVPIMFVTGQFEEVMPPGHVRDAWWGVQMARFYTDKKAVPHALIGGMLDRGYGHLNWFPAMSRYAALFLHKAIKARLNRSDHLRPVTFSSGWLCDPTGRHRDAPVQKYTGNAQRAFWVFDGQQARAWHYLFFRDSGKKQRMIAFTLHGKIAPWWPGWALQELPWQPLSNGISFKVHAVFRKKVPRIFSNAGMPLGSADHQKIKYCVLGWAGQIRQVGPNEFRLRFNREGVNGRTLHLLIGAYVKGTRKDMPAIAVASIFVPGSNSGTPQKIDFPPIANVSAGVRSMALRATVNSPLRVHYYVDWGPAKVVGQRLVFTKIPVATRWPVVVRITAYQWGKSTPPAYATAPMITRSFYITPSSRSLKKGRK
jgi:hypothetical protein